MAGTTPYAEDTLAGVPGWDLERLRAMRVLVVGAGALGNEVLKNLALVGVGQICIVDFDVVEQGNLTRSVLYRAEDVGKGKAETAAARLLEINPDLDVKCISADIMHGVGLGVMRRMDAIIGCVDNRLARLWLNRWAFRAGKAWVSGGILQFSGQLAAYQRDMACYECGLSPAAWQDIKGRMGCTDMAQRYLSQGLAPTTSIAASVIGALQVQEALKMALGEPGLAGKMWSFEGLNRHAEVYDFLPPKEVCESHFLYKEIVECGELSAESSLEETFAVLEAKFGEGLWIDLDHAVGTELATFESKERFEVLVALPELSESLADRYRQIAGEGVGVPRGKLHSRLDRTFARQDAKLRELGIPFLHVLRVRTGKGTYYVELSKDVELLSRGKSWPGKIFDQL